jgi:steroid 5-alpha reductase family enzyme
MSIFDYIPAIVPMLLAGSITWLISIYKRDVSIVDSLWSLFFIISALYIYSQLEEPDNRALAILILVSLWAVRLAGYITIRHWGHDEDHRYAAIRANYDPGFEYKSLYMIFAFQALTAWIISLPLFYAMQPGHSPGLFDLIGLLLWLTGMYFEVVGDYQLWRFRRKAENRGKIFTRGLWQYTRHPNYFGEFLIWWGFYCLALSAGAYWVIVSPLLMSFFLMKFSGVGRLEQTMKQRAGYEHYMQSTSAFFPYFKSGEQQ